MAVRAAKGAWLSKGGGGGRRTECSCILLQQCAPLGVRHATTLRIRMTLQRSGDDDDDDSDATVLRHVKDKQVDILTT